MLLSLNLHHLPVIAQAETCQEEQQVELEVKSACEQLILVEKPRLLSRSAALEPSFTKFRKARQVPGQYDFVKRPCSLESPELRPEWKLAATFMPPATYTPSEKSQLYHLRGGESAALAYLHSEDFLKRLETYEQHRNELEGGTKLSAFLAFGCLSLPCVYEHARQSIESCDHFLMHLLVREYRQHQAETYGTKIFRAQGLKDTDAGTQWAH
jgi:deoxyribodipyrimidine photolyase